MTEIEREALLAARLFVDGLKKPVGNKELVKMLAAQIAHTATRLSRPPAGFVRDDAGVDRRVLGTLPVTADGCVAGDGARIIFPQLDGSLNYEHVCTRGLLGPIQSGFSTPAAAAEAAAEKGGSDGA